MEQRSPEWFAARAGKATASRMADIVAKTKSGYASASREAYCVELALEIITGVKRESFSSAAMQWGVDNEAAARGVYEVVTGKFVTEVGFFDHPTVPMSGASPDGMIDDGLIEIKCPESKQHLQNLLTKKPDNKYYLQMQWQMACTMTKWCDFVSYDPRFPEHLQLLIVRVPRDEKVIAELENEVRTFRKEVDAIVDKLEGMK